MSKQSVERAIILAAGRGSRLAQDGDTLPKPLRPVAGVPLIVRILRTLATAGIREAVVVVGFQGDRIRAALTAPGLSLGLSVTFVDNPHWERSNGLSVLAAAPFIDRECLLSMSDHLVAPALVSRLLRADIPAGACALGVDYDIERCFDLDDATKVQVADQQIVSISKELLEYNAIDTGLFRINAALVESLRGEEARRGDASLSDGVRALAADGALRGRRRGRRPLDRRGHPRGPRPRRGAGAGVWRRPRRTASTTASTPTRPRRPASTRRRWSSSRPPGCAARRRTRKTISRSPTARRPRAAASRG
jgi:1L-myo-inositol 1-phosphate cytidylyltransferase